VCQNKTPLLELYSCHFIPLGVAARSVLNSIPKPIPPASEMGGDDKASTSVVSDRLRLHRISTGGERRCVILKFSKPALRGSSRESQQNSEGDGP
jgi:hypothetical protein